MTNESDEIEATHVETLRTFADITEAGSVRVDSPAWYLREIADHIERLETDVIDVHVGDEVVTIEGDDATRVIKASVQQFITDAVREHVRYLDGVTRPSDWQLP